MAKIVTYTLPKLENGACEDIKLLHQYNFYEKNGFKVLNIKLVGPGLAALNGMSSPVDDISLQKTGNTLVFGDQRYGWDNVQDIKNIAKQSISDYKIEKLNIIINTHGVIKDGIYYLGLGYDPEGIMGSPQWINSNDITKELSELSQLVAATDIISVACYGNHQIRDKSFINFKNTIFCAFSDSDVTWQGDLFNNDMSFTDFFEQFNINVMVQCLTEYFKNVKEKQYIPYTTKVDNNKITKIDFPKLSTSDILTLGNNVFLQKLIEQRLIELSVPEMQNLLTKALTDSDGYIEYIKNNNPKLFGAVLGISFYSKYQMTNGDYQMTNGDYQMTNGDYQMTNGDNLPEPCNLIGENDGME